MYEGLALFARIYGLDSSEYYYKHDWSVLNLRPPLPRFPHYVLRQARSTYSNYIRIGFSEAACAAAMENGAFHLRHRGTFLIAP